MGKPRLDRLAKRTAIRVAVIGTAAIGLSLGTPGFADEPAPINEHVVLPTTTDSSIDPTLANHYAWFNPDVSNHQLLVYLPGNSGVPKNALLFQQRAAQLGYHVIGLAYETGNSLSRLCNSDPDPNSCFYNAHYEIVYGVDTSPKVEVGKSNNIVHLLTALLRWLADAYPAEGWSRFLNHGSPRWSSIALSGLSQGAGNAAMIAKYSVVPRVVLLSGVTDAIPGPQPCQGSRDWLTDHRTPVVRYWGLGHDRDPNYPAICRNWDSIGISALGPLVQVEDSAPPYAGSHQLFTDLLPQTLKYADAHPSTVADTYTPRDANGTPKLAMAWDYLLTSDASEEEADD
jgi:hypothetical protein